MLAIGLRLYTLVTVMLNRELAEETQHNSKGKAKQKKDMGNLTPHVYLCPVPSGWCPLDLPGSSEMGSKGPCK